MNERNIDPERERSPRFERAVADPTETDAVRRLMADELHDCALQLLIAAHEDLREPPSDPESLAATRDMLDAAIAEIRRILDGTPQPAVSSTGGLAAGLQTLCDRAAERAGVVATSDVEPGADGGPYDDLLFVLAREFVENTIKHAHAGRLELTVRVHEPYIELAVTDDGCGMPHGRSAGRMRRQRGHLGLPAAERRVRGAGGSLTVDVRPGGGTTMTVLLPAGTPALLPQQPGG
jgi:signal transduction histidine kinase